MSSIGHVVIASHPRPPSPTDDIVDRDADTEPSINGDVQKKKKRFQQTQIIRRQLWKGLWKYFLTGLQFLSL